jgi:hypothetical protein
MTRTQLEIAMVCDDIKNLLLRKNANYGDSAINPSRIFSKASAVEQILVRIDDKLSRIGRGAGLVANDEDVIDDLIGYLVLLKIAQKREGWDGTDIEPAPASDELLRLHVAGDKFA